VANQTRHWSEGRSLVFDDTYIHQVWNDTDEYRAILFVDFLRPLRPPMRQINEAIVKVASYSPPLREAAKKQAAWEARFFDS
jgi:beta-hydroxylase